jgi:cystathionine gamma-synthase/methionine-gamma-lyase
MDRIFGGEVQDYVYSRYRNPTTAALEQTLADVDSGDNAIVFCSGMAAVHAAFLSLELSPASRLLVSKDIYGATYNLCLTLLAPFGVQVEFLDLLQLTNLEKELAQTPKPRALFLEVITNPLLNVIDFQECIRLCSAAGVPVIIDNTFGTPALTRPLESGAAMVVHSTTKFLAGHGDSTGGVVVVKDPARAATLRMLGKVAGGVASPFESWLTLRGIKTFTLRMSQIFESAAEVARFLERHPRIEGVRYPGLASHPHHAVARKLFRDRGYGGLVAFQIKEADKSKIFEFMDALMVINRATTLGDIYSQVLYPAVSSHRDLSPKQRDALGIHDNLLRLSIGIENKDDLIEDLDEALGATS